MVTRTVETTEMPIFTNEEYADMHFVYGFCDRNSLAALMEYQQQYSDRRQPYRCVFEMVHCNMRETGTLMPHARAGCGRCNVWDEEDVLDIIHGNPSISTPHISSAAGWFLRVQYDILCGSLTEKNRTTSI
jgi:hypothetical protein